MPGNYARYEDTKMDDADNIAIFMIAMVKDPERTGELMAKLTSGELGERELAEVSAELYLLGDGATPAEFKEVLERGHDDPEMAEVNAYSLNWLRKAHPEVFGNEG